jgi:hypothetical protein
MFKDSEFCQIIIDSKKPFIEIRPNNDNTVSSLEKWIQKNYAILRKRMCTDGGILFKGFDVKSPEDFEIVASSIEPNLCNTHDFDDGVRLWFTEHVYEASLSSIAQDNIPLSFHNEDAFVPYVPSTIMLCSLQASPFGGETLMADCRKVFASLPYKLQKKFLGRTIKNTFTMSDSIFLVNTRIQKNEEEIIKLAKKYGSKDVYRLGESNTRFTFEIPAIIKHESSDDPIWFSRAHQVETLSRIVDIWHSYKYRKNFFSIIEGFFVMAKTIIQHYWSKIQLLKVPHNKRNTCTFENGENISIIDQFKICSAYWKNAVIEPLEAGDIMILDNRLVTHGRLPYKGNRKLLSCIGNQVMVKEYISNKETTKRS